jgi:hypothetical protein
MDLRDSGMPRATGGGMGKAQRFGIRIGRSWMLLLLLMGVIAAAAYWLGPAQAPPPAIHLLVVGEAGDAAPGAEATLRADRDGNGVQRFALPLFVQNVGSRPGQPTRVTFSVPSRFRIVTTRGALPSEVTPGVPLRRYVLPVAAPPLQPGDPPVQLRGLETVWLEPDLPAWFCLDNNGVPEFVPSPQLDPTALAEVRIFYSLATRRASERSTGVITLHLDPGQLAVRSVPMPPVFPTVLDEVHAGLPDLGPLRYVGERRALCGEPEQPMELFTVTWATAAGARMHVIYVHDAPRKHLYDMNGDGTIDLEVWDATGDGHLDARRQAQFAAPDFLQPLPRRADALFAPDTVPPDSAWLALFHNRLAGPFRFTQERRAAAAPRTAEAAPGVAADLDDLPGPLPPPDSAWLELFRQTDAGPFRFARARRPPPGDPAPGVPAEPGRVLPGAVPAPSPEPPVAEPDTSDAPPPAAPRPPTRRTTPLGTPVRPGGGTR